MRSETTRHATVILAAVAACMALQMTGQVMILPLFPRRFDSFGAGVEAFGISSMAFALTSTVAAPFMGMLADRFGRRPVILLSLAAYGLAFTGFLFATAAWQLILLRGAAGVFTAGLVPAMLTIVGDLASADRRGRWIGIVNGSASIGWIVGPELGGLLYDGFGYGVPFATAIAMAVSALLLAVLLIPETSGRVPRAHQLRPAWVLGFQGVQALPTWYMLMLISFGVLFAWAFIEPQFMFYAYDQLGWTSSQLGLAIGAYGFACMAGEFTLSQLSDRVGRKPVLVLGLALFSAQFIGLAVFRDMTWIVLSFVLAGLGNALYDPALSAHILDITAPEHRGRILALRGTAGSLGSMLGPALVVLFTPFIGPQAVFLIAAGLVVALTLAAGTALRAPQAAAVAAKSS